MLSLGDFVMVGSPALVKQVFTGDSATLHAGKGNRILEPIDFLKPIRPLVRHAHERWDGNGYPDELAGEEIPLGARIVFACDAYDAMTTDRPYKKALSDADARQQLIDGAGTQFDPRVVEVLLEVLDQ